MLLKLFLWNIFTIPIIYSSNVTLNAINGGVNKTLSAKEIPKEIGKQVPIVSEGGPTLHDVPVPLPKANLTLELLNLDKETGKTKEKPIHPRKGVDYPLDIAVAQNNTKGDSDSKSNSLQQQFDIAIKNQKITTLAPPAVINETVVPEKIKIQNTTKTAAPKKPLKVSYDTLEKLEQKFDTNTKIPLVKSSSKTIVNDQMPSPNKETNTKIYSMASKHPGMVTPIVITILVVPMFAVLGYMAIKRGQEAWKNRHYKRMDFLLDGMYND